MSPLTSRRTNVKTQQAFITMDNPIRPNSTGALTLQLPWLRAVFTFARGVVTLRSPETLVPPPLYIY